MSTELSLFQRDRKEAEFRAKELYFEGKKQAEICQLVGITPDILKNHIYGQKGSGGWKAEREAIEAKALRQINNLQKERYAKLLNETLIALERSVTALNAPERDEETGQEIIDPVTLKPKLKILSVGEMEKISKIAGTMQVMLDHAQDAEDAATLRPGQVRMKLTVETLLQSLQEVDPIGFGADAWGDDENEAIEVDFDVV